MPLQALNGESTEVRATVARPGFRAKGRRGRPKNTNRQNLRIRCQSHSMRTVLPCLPVLIADQSIGKKMEKGRLAGKRSAAQQTAAQIREPPHQTRRPQGKVS